jgi:hypothetical protein
MIRLCSYHARYAVELVDSGTPQAFAGVTLVTADSSRGIVERYGDIHLTAVPATLRQIAEALLFVADEAEKRAGEIIPAKDDA